MNHAERYEYLTTKLSSMRWRGGELDCSYQAALYLMASPSGSCRKGGAVFLPRRDRLWRPDEERRI